MHNFKILLCEAGVIMLLSECCANEFDAGEPVCSLRMTFDF